MLLGATGAFSDPRVKERLAASFTGVAKAVGDAGRGCLALVRPWGVAPLDAEERVARDPVTGSWLVFSGHLFRDLASGEEGPMGHAASSLLARLSAKGVAVLGEIDGAFAFAFYDARIRRLHLARDRFGEEPLFYGLGPGGALFGSRARDLVATGLLPKGLCPHGLASFLAFGFVPGEATLDAQIRRVPAGGVVVLDAAGNVLSTERWFRPSFSPAEAPEAADPARLRALLEDAVARRVAGPRTAALLAPQAALRGVAGLARRRIEPPIPVYDLAATLRREEDAFAIGEAVAAMDVPAGDPGLDVAEWIAAREAAGAIDRFVAGCGAEEIFASHPSYAAQARIVRVERFGFARGALRTLHDLSRRLGNPVEPGDRRRAWKSLLPDPGAPPELGAFRWRVLRAPEEILALVTAETARDLAPANPWKSVLEAVDACDGSPSGLARDLAIGAVAAGPPALERRAALRRHGIGMATPCHDVALAEFAACIPARAKRARDGHGRGLLDATLGDVTLPAPSPELWPGALVERWLAGDGVLARRVAKLLASEALRARGLFRPEAVKRLVVEHRTRQRDHTARIWSLVVLELWLRARETGEGVGPSGGAPAPGW